METSWKSETCLVTDKLGKVTFEVMACLTVKMMQNTEIYPYFPHDTRWKKRKQCINYNSVTHKSYPLQSSNFINIFMRKQVLLEWNKTGPVASFETVIISCWLSGTSWLTVIRSQQLTGLPTSTEFPYFVRNLHAKYGSTNLAYKIRKLSSVSSVT